MRLFLAIFISLLFAVFTGGAIATETGFNVYWVVGALFALSFIKMPHGITVMALEVEIWKQYIIDNLFAGNEFLNYAVNADEHVLQGKIVHIPNAGAPSNVERNRTKLPAQVTQRKDIDVLYALDEFTTDPRLVREIEKAQLSYPKMDSVMREDMAYIKQLVAQWMLYNWKYKESDDFIIRTTGDAIATHLTGASGTRKKLKLSELKEAQARFDEWDIPADGRFAMFDARMHEQLVAELDTTASRDFSRAYDPAKGIVGELYGFKIMKRSSLIRANNVATPVIKMPNTANAATDNGVALCWHELAVERAIGDVKAFDDKGSPYYYGDIVSFLLAAGGRARRDDGKGVIGIVQSAT